MDAQRTKQAIQDIFRENLNVYEDYPLDRINGKYLVTEEASEMATDVAESYWQHRQEHEVERDEKNNVTLIHYVAWCHAELASWIQEKNEDIEAAAKHFQDIYQEEIAANEVTGDVIHEWWSQTVDQYPNLSLEDIEAIETLIFNAD